MPKFLIFTHLSPQGRKHVRHDPGSLPDISAELSGVDAKIVAQYAMLGPQDFLTIVDVPVPLDGFKLAVADRGAEGVIRTVVPAIDLPLFVRLLGQTTETVGPHKWQITAPARAARSVLQAHYVGSTVKKYLKPLEIRGSENVADLRGPAIFIGNHTSHMDSSTLLYSIPKRYRTRVYFGGAADRWFLKGRKGIKKQGWWQSLVYGSFPVHRAGGSKGLDYPKWLIDKGFSVAIFPEGTRSGSGKLGKFRHGVSILALDKNVPVVPLYMSGLAAVRPKGAREMQPAPVIASIGRPIRFEPGTTVSDATHQLQKAVEALRDELTPKETASVSS